MQAANSPEVHAGYGTHGKTADGNGKGCCGVGTAQNVAAGKRYPPIDAKGGDEMTNAQLDHVRQLECAIAWEELNAVDPKAESAIEDCEMAIKLLCEAETLLLHAAEQFDGTITETHLLDIMRATESIECDIHEQAKRLKGWK